MHLAYPARQASICVDNHCRVVKQPRRTTFKQSGHEHNAQTGRRLAKPPGGWAGDRLGQCKMPMVHALAKVKTGKQLLQTNHLRPQSGSPLDLFE